MNLFSKIFGKPKLARKSAVDSISTDTETKAVDDFSKLSKDNRLITIMKLDAVTNVNLSLFWLVKYAILSDPDLTVKFAALKRIHLFKDHPGLIPMMTKLKEENDHENLEPYLSMALNRLGLISLADLEKK